MSAIDLAAFRRRFVRAKLDPTDPDYDPTADDTFFAGVVVAEFAAQDDGLVCAACGGPDICRTPLTRPGMFGTITTASGHAYGYALCTACNSDREAAIPRVDAAFAGGV